MAKVVSVITRTKQLFGQIFIWEETLKARFNWCLSDGNRLFWFEFQSGCVKTSMFNGSDLRQILCTNTSNNYGFYMYESYIYVAAYNRILRVHKENSEEATILHVDPSGINSILMLEIKGNQKCWIIHWQVEIKQLFHLLSS